MKWNNDFRYDLMLGQIKEKQVANILQNKKIEVKTDYLAHKTGNIAIEYESRGNPSGIATTEADYYIYIIPHALIADTMLILNVKELKKITRLYYKINRVCPMGDDNTSMAVLIPIDRLFKINIDT